MASVLANLVRWVRPYFSPGPGVDSRASCEMKYGAEWALMIVQARMSEEASQHMSSWYECQAATTLAMPTILQAEETPEPVVPGVSSAPELETQSVMPAKADERVDPLAPLMERLDILKAERLIGELPSPPSNPIAVGSASPKPDEASPSDAIVPYAGEIHLGYEELQRESSTSLEAEPLDAHDEVDAGTLRKVSMLLDRAFLSVGNALTPAVGAALAVFSAPAGQYVEPPEMQGPNFPTEVEGSAMRFMNAHSVAMELRKRYGLQPKTPANVQLGGRVAREILGLQCGATREQVWYLGQLATSMWFQPTLVDLALGAGAKDF
ncbi:hypothetical protein [Paederia scandens chlorosis yellow umbravirus]|nr:hypothetical protein [Paederia scandens chlorosis yellow umbravirus]